MRAIALLFLLPAVALASGQKVQKATASQVVLFGPLANSADASAHTTTVVDSDIVVCQDSGSCAAKSDLTDCTHVGDGVHSCPLDDTDTNAEESVCLINSVTDTLPLMQCFEVQAPTFTDLQNGDEELLTSTMAGLNWHDTINSVTSQTEFTLNSGPSNDDALVTGSKILFVDDLDSTFRCEGTIDDYIDATATVIIQQACSDFTIGVNDEVFAYVGPSGPAVQNANNTLTDVDASVTNLESDIANVQDALDEYQLFSGACDSGSTSTCVDADLTQVDDYWEEGAAIVFTDGTLDGQTRCVTNFDAASDELTFEPVVTEGVTTHGYALIAAPSCGALLDSAILASTFAANAIDASKIAADAIGASELATDAVNEVRDAHMQYALDNGVTFEEAMCYALSILAGEADFTAGAPDQSVFQDPTGTDTRVTVQYGVDNGDRTSVVLNALNCGSN